MPLIDCSSPVNPCSPEDACMPVAHTTLVFTDTGTAGKAVLSSDDLPKESATGKE
ncbi:MAG TPA: hypothetical protein VEF34_09595 [Syntrophobacteraceae bacterium]|nr:hypothetical protein [Syntrophobacteraceae bacterium]